jgi:hypothetical protein
MSAEFDIGTKVVCIRDDWYGPPNAGERWPCKGDILTIREITSNQENLADSGLYFRFLEIINPPCGRSHGEAAFIQHSFRPVRKTDISAFTELLETPPLDFEVAGDSGRTLKECIVDLREMLADAGVPEREPRSLAECIAELREMLGMPEIGDGA